MLRSVLLSLPLRAAAACSVDEDCQLSGICFNGVCQCDPMWKGDDCSELNFLAPDDIQPVYPPPDLVNETTSWGASVLRDPETGLFHMFVAEMANGCGMATWSTNSQIAYATSATAEGPYTRKATVAVPFAHNPTVARSPDGSWVLFQIGCGDQQAVGPCSNCAGGVTTGSCSLPWETVSCDASPTPAKTPMTAHIFHASAPDGPWVASDIELENVSKPPSMGKFGLDNPAPYFFPNGSLLILARCDMGSVGDVRADSWKGPYRMGHEIGISDVEDPHIYRDRRGAFHALFHSGRQGSKACGAHAFSADGLNWTRSTKPAYITDITTKSGTVVAFRRRERPHLVLDKDGQPSHLVTALTNHVGGHRGNDKAFTHMHALNTKPPKPPAPPAPPGPTPSPTPTGSCITPNILYDSHKDGNILLDRQYHTASNSTACQALCHATDACVCFSHRKSLGHCWLMTSCQRPDANEMYDSGKANCFANVQV